MDKWLILFTFALFQCALCRNLGLKDLMMRAEEESDNTDPQGIIGGQNAGEDSWPWQVLLLYGGNFICGGTLLDENTVLTAAHCTIGGKRKKFKVVLGDYNRKKKEPNRGEQRIKLKKIFQHPQYDDWTLEHDMSILKLKSSAVLGDYVQPIPGLAQPDMDLINSTCFVTGWGAFKGPNSAAKKLQELEVPVITNDECEDEITYEGDDNVKDDMICTNLEPKGACYGDSGGPLQCSVDGVWVHAGVVSWGNPGDCKDGPTVYSRTSYHLDWINSYL